MSNARHAPYGADDDPFLTHPAGPGQGQRRAQSPEYWAADQAAGGHYGYDAPRRAGYAAAPQPRYDAPQQAAGYDQGGYGQPHHVQPHHVQPQYDQAQYDQSHYAPNPHSYYATGHGAAPHPAPQQSGNFRPRVPAYALHSQPLAQPLAQPTNGAQGGYADPAYADPAFDGFDPPNPMPHSPNQDSPNQHSLNHRSFAAPPRYAAPSYTAQSYTAARTPSAQMPAPRGEASHPYGDVRASFALPAVPSGQWVQWAGALCTILALIGAGYWGYKLAVRDANGIPVVRATLGPLRMAPETPGGEVSAHQGLAVNAIPATGASSALPDQITLAPQTADLALEDTALTEAGSFAAAGIATSGAGQIEALAGASDQILAQPQAGGSALAALADLPNSLPEDMPLTDAEAVERALAAALAEGGDSFADTAQVLDAAPAESSAEPASMSNTDPIAPPTAELDPATIPLGTPMVQFGAFDTADIARAEWATLQTRFTELMAGKALVVEQRKSGGRDFFRLRAHGFDTTEDTRRFCAAILAENGTCLTVDQR